ncbi:hypothetical protein Tco_1406403 [Tanacetum coccineum]
MSSETKLTWDEDEESIDNTKYHGMIGSLLNLTASRSDIMFSVFLCAHFKKDPKSSHLEAVKRIFTYIKGSTQLGLWYPNGTGVETIFYADSDHSRDYVDHKSTSVESSEDQESLGVLEDASKQGRSIADIDADVEVTLVDETQVRQNDDLIFDTGVLDDVEMPVEAKVDGKNEQSTKTDYSTTGEAVTTPGDDSVIPTTNEEITLAQTLIQIKGS